MRTMNGGYAMINLASATIYADVLAALASNKPIVVYEATGAPYYADSVTTSGTSIIITKGGKTITITDANSVSSEGDVATKQVHQYQITLEVDKSGSTYELHFVHTTLDDFEDVTNGSLTVEIANTIVKDYGNILMYDVSNNFVVCSNGNHFDNDGDMDFYSTDNDEITLSIVSDSKYSIKKLF